MGVLVLIRKGPPFLFVLPIRSVSRLNTNTFVDVVPLHPCQTSSHGLDFKGNTQKGNNRFKKEV